MALFRFGLLACLLASTSYAFAFKPTAPAQRSLATRAPVNLSMSGGQAAVPDLKPPPALYEGAVAAGQGTMNDVPIPIPIPTLYRLLDAAYGSSSVSFSLRNTNTAKASASWEKIFKLGIAAGCHIGFGSYLAITVGGACPAIAEANPGLQKVREHI